MGEYFTQFIIAGLTMGVIDAVWLGVVAKSFYKSQIGNLMLASPNWIAAVVFYVIYITGIIVFVITPALDKGSWQHAFGYGALFGLVAYGTIDLTNRATLKGFSTKYTVIDLLWGVTLTATVCFVTYYASSRWMS